MIYISICIKHSTYVVGLRKYSEPKPNITFDIISQLGLKSVDNIVDFYIYFTQTFTF